MTNLVLMGKNAKSASYELGILSTKEKDNALKLMSEEIINFKNEIIDANKLDMENAKNKNMSEALLERLLLDERRIDDMANAILDIVKLPDPVGEVISMWQRPNKLQMGKKRVPIGVIGIIYESRPNVTCDAAALCLKSGNAVILRGGSDAINSNKAIAKALKEGIKKANLPEYSIQLIEDTSREVANEMMKLNDYIDVLIPRGGANLIKSVVNNSNIPVIQTGTGNCHIYVDESADFQMAIDIIINSKTQRPGACNAAEKILVHKNIANEFLPKVVKTLKDNNVEVRGDKKSKDIVNDIILIEDENEWYKEYLDLIIGVKIVDNVGEAIDRINMYGTHHSEAIITESYKNSQIFLQKVDSSAVYVNASTRFTDGGEFGFGAEIGISTQKLHARGPMGLQELTTIKYIVFGEGQIR